MNPNDDEQPLDGDPLPGPVEELHARHLAGDAEASEKLAAQVTPQLQRLARELGAAHEHGEDAVQDAWVALLSQRGYDRRRPLLPWLRGALRNRWRALRRRERLLGRQDDEETLAGLESPRAVNSAEALEAFRLVREALARLPLKYREPLELHLFAEWSPSEIASRLGSSPQRVRVLLHRGRQRLQRLLPRGAFVLLAGLLRRERLQHVPRSTWGLGALAAALLALVIVPFASSRAAEDPAWMAARPAERESAQGRTFAAETASSEAAARRLVVSEELASARSVFVRDVHGAPLANVGVTLEPRDGRDPRLARWRAVTDEQGRAQFVGSELGAARVRLDRGPSGELAAGELRLELVVSSGVTLRARAVDAQGVGIAGAAIWLGDLGGSRSGGVVAESASDGRFELHEVPQDASFAVLAPGFCRTRMLDVPPGGDDELVVRLERGGSELTLTLRDERGAPVADARVLAGNSSDGLAPRLAGDVWPEFPPTIEARSDERGRVEVRGLEPGRHPLVVWAAGFVAQVETLEVEGNAPQNLELTLERGARVRGRIVDEHGAALAVAQVALRTGREPDDTLLEVSPRGEFELLGLRAGTLELAVRAWDHGAQELELELAPCEQRELVFRLERLVRCDGTVRDDSGRALAGGRLRLLGAPTSLFAPNSDEATLDADGSFSLAVPGEQIRRMEFALPGSPQWNTVRRAWLVEGAGRLDIVVPSQHMQGRWLRGRLRAADERTVARRTLSVLDHSRGGDCVPLERIARTADDGSFELGPLAPGLYDLFVVRDRSDAERAPLGFVGAFELLRIADLQREFELPEPAEWRWNLAFSDGSAPRAPVVELTLPGASLELARADGSEGSFLVWPANFDLRAQGEDFVALRWPPRGFRSVETCTWSPVLVAAVAVELDFANLPATVPPFDELQIVGAADGSVVVRFESAGERAAEGTRRVYLALGEYRLCVQGLGERRELAAFEVRGPGRVNLRQNP